MTQASVASVETSAPTSMAKPSRERRLFALAVVLTASLLHFVVSSFYFALGGVPPSGPGFHAYRLLGALIAESTSLLVLWYIVSERPDGWTTIGWNPNWRDIWRGIGVLVVSLLATIPPSFIFEYGYRTLSGHYLQPKDLRPLLGFGISALSIAFVLVNPVFEELIVRAYTMSEVMDLGGSRFLAIVLSVGIQVSYHLYQGVVRTIAVAATFTVFSIYFARTRRIMPVMLAHFCIDAYALFRGRM